MDDKILPEGTSLNIQKQELADLVRKQKVARESGGSLKASEQKRLLELSKLFEKQAQEPDGDPLKTAWEAGAFNTKSKEHATKDDVIYRVEMICEWMDQGKRTPWMLEYVTRNWGIGFTSLMRYMKKAREKKQKDLETNRSKALGTLLGQIGAAYSLAAEEKDVAAMLAATKHGAEMLGLNVQRNEITGKNGAPLGPMAVFQCLEKVFPTLEDNGMTDDDDENPLAPATVE